MMVEDVGSLLWKKKAAQALVASFLQRCSCHCVLPSPYSLISLPYHPTASEAGPSSGMRFDASNAHITGRDVASRNVSIAGQNNVVNQTFPFSGLPDGVDAVLSWLEPHAADYFPAHEEARSRRAPGTGKWFFDTDIYSEWATKDVIELRNVECIGIPGAGKTTLASGAVEDLRNRYMGSPDNNIVLYVYFRHDTQTLQKIPNVLASLLRQVVKKRKQVSEELQELYEEYSSNPDIVPAADKTIKILQLELMVYRTTFIVVDALDEYSTDSYSYSHAFVSQLERLNARLLITSRHHVDFTPETFSTLDISARAEDIHILVKQHVTGNLAKVIDRTPSLLEEIVATVIAKADGMFIIAKLLVDAIPDLLSSTDIRTTLKMLLTGLRDTYLMTMKRIWQQKSHIMELANKTLCWVFFAKRRLTVLELQHAISFHPGEGSALGEDLIAEDLILSSCLGLIVFVKNEDSVLESQFAHFTTKEFLNTCWQDYFPDGEQKIAETCLEYLSAAVSVIPSDITERVISSLNPHNDNEWHQYRTSKFALCLYAATFWGVHTNAIKLPNLDAGTSFFKHSISPYVSHPGHTCVLPTMNMPPAHYWILYSSRYGLLTCLLQLTSSLTTIQNHDGPQAVSLEYNDVRDKHERTALHLAAYSGHLNIVEFLLERTADPNRLNGDGLLPNCCAIADQRDRFDRAPIFFAILSDRPSLEIIRLLLQHEVDIYRKDDLGHTPLSYTQNKENPEIKGLLEEYARTHPPIRRAYAQIFPGGHHSASDSESKHTPELESEQPQPEMASSTLTSIGFSATGSSNSSVHIQSTVAAGTSIRVYHVADPPVPQIVTDAGHLRAKPGFKWVWTGITRPFRRRGPK